ncbi:MerR family DNA-binding transcriptional regulator [Nonomuraea typhae]|nr:MerR family DNA-binding transcriptional regulator [Nonomuraea typhae]
MADQPTMPRLLTRVEVAARFGVDPHTVTRWPPTVLPYTHTPGGHRP